MTGQEEIEYYASETKLREKLTKIFYEENPDKSEWGKSQGAIFIGGATLDGELTPKYKSFLKAVWK